MSRIPVILLLLLLSANLLWSAATPDPQLEVAKLEIVNLKVSVSVLENQLALYDKFYNEQKALLEAKYKNTIEEITNTISQEKSQIIIIEWLVGIFGVFGIGSVIVFFLNIKKFAEAKVKEYSGSIIEKIFTTEKNRFIKIIDAEKYEERIKREKKILVYTNQKLPDNAQLKGLFKKYNFQGISYGNEEIFKEINLEEYDLIFLNEWEEKINEAVRVEIIKNCPRNTSIFFFCQNRVDKIDKQYYNFANGYITLYPRIVELFSYRDYMEGAYK